MMHGQAILSRLAGLGEGGVSGRVLDVLRAAGTRPVGPAPAQVSAAEALRLWRTRLENTRLTGTVAPGLEQLVAGLNSLDQQVLVQQYGFANARATCVLLFEAPDGPFIGALTVETEDAG